MVKIHPLAGKCGEGPPLAPELWRWRAGNRLNDMYFTSPTGEKFRSRPELSVYLATLANPPSADSFQWRVTEEFLAKNQVASWDARTPKRDHSGEGSTKLEKGEGKTKEKTGKRKEVTKDTSNQGRKKVKLEFPSPSQQPSIPEKSPLPCPEPVLQRSDIAMTVGMFSTPTTKPRPKMKASKKAKFDRIWEDAQYFTRVLASKVSWKWLYDNEAATKFLAEAEKLKEKSDSEIADLRNVLLHRSSDMSNISRYSNQVLRVFVQILRNVQPPSTMGKVELADLVVNWKCKKRHYWCLLETSRLAPPQSKPLKADGSSSRPRDDRVAMQHATGTNKGSIPAHQDRTNVGDVGNSIQGETRARLEKADANSNDDLQLEVTLKDIQETVKTIEETHLTSAPVDSSVDLNVKVFTASDDNSKRLLEPKEVRGHLVEFEDHPMGQVDTRTKSPPIGQSIRITDGSGGLGVTGRPEQGSLASGSVYNVQYKMSESVVILDRINKNARGGQQEDQGVKVPRTENTESGSADVSRVVKDMPQTPQTPPMSSFSPLSYHFPRENSVCWCNICAKDQAFCRGCMCCLCPDPVKPEDDWMAVRCNCKHLCHIKCALENNLAGVVKGLNLDVELSCPSCSRRVDLWPFFEKSVDHLLGFFEKSTSTDFETLASLVLRLLDGTQNRKYTYLRELVVELHHLPKKFSIQNLVQQLLLEIKAELHEPLHPDSDATKVAEYAMGAAIRKRAEIEPLFNTLGKAYQSVIEQTRQVREVQVSYRVKQNEVEHPDTVKTKDFSALVAQQENQKRKAKQEFQKLVQIKSSTVKPNNSSLAAIDSSMYSWLEDVREQRRAVEAAETELDLLTTPHNQSSGM